LSTPTSPPPAQLGRYEILRRLGAGGLAEVFLEGPRATVHTGLPGLAAELAWSDLCFSAASLTKYEAAYLGVPAGVPSHVGACIVLSSRAHDADRSAMPRTAWG